MKLSLSLWLATATIVCVHREGKLCAAGIFGRGEFLSTGLFVPESSLLAQEEIPTRGQFVDVDNSNLEGVYPDCTFREEDIAFSVQQVQNAKVTSIARGMGVLTLYLADTRVSTELVRS
eukprot:scaffold115_cov304-Prasinococcus_capsulatus_cf.AAC.15